ncbi:MAG: DUF3160 domain-containing protein, partial [Patescibacteria group bacterium]
DEKLPPIVKGLVEPNVLFWRKLDALVTHTQELFEKNGLFKDQTATERLSEFSGIVKFFTDLAEKELKGTALSDDEYEKLRAVRIAFMGDPLDGTDQPEENGGRVGLVADIHTDVPGNSILYEGTGQPYLMLTLVGNENAPRLVLGLAYNHYEFAGPLGGNRETDEEWKKKAYDDPTKLPKKNFWYDTLTPKAAQPTTVSVR